MRFTFLCGLFISFILSALPASAQSALTADRWLQHLNEDLLPFWDQPAAYGQPLGLFPSTRCNSGLLYQKRNPCEELGAGQLQNLHLMPTLSRQVFAYGVAFHLTGERRFLDLAKAGAAYLTGPGLDPDSGGHFESFKAPNGGWAAKGGRINLQKQVYALLGPSFLYYLTRDPELLTMIEGVRQIILNEHRDEDTGAYLWRRRSVKESAGTYLVASLDQLNTIYLLNVHHLPPALKADWLREIAWIAADLEGRFYDADLDGFQNDVGKPPEELNAQAISFGHTAKTWWHLAAAGAVLGDEAMTARAKAGGARMLLRSFDKAAGGWREDDGGANQTINFFSFTEQSQLAGAIAIADPAWRDITEQANRFWLERFVDHADGGVFNALSATGERLEDDRPKHWTWKAGFHSFEHALFGVLNGAAIEGAPVDLFYAFGEEAPSVAPRPYHFGGEILEAAALGDGVWRYRFDNVRFPAEGR